ncbi:MAG: LemA family protein [Micavibrio sp.]
MNNTWIIVAIILIPLVFVIMLYNRLIALRQTRKNAFSDIDVQLKQRFDLVPQLVETVKGYAGHEKTVFENVTEARARVGRAGGSGPAGERLQAEGALGAAMMNLFAVAENYPALKADQNFQQLQAELSDIENKIAAARRFFNSATNEYNTAVQQFPANLIANMFGFKEEAFFEVDAAESAAIQKAPTVSFS